MLPLLNSWLCGISAGVVCESVNITIFSLQLSMLKELYSRKIQ